MNQGLKELFGEAADEAMVVAYGRRLAGLDLSEDDEGRADALEAMVETMLITAASDGEVATEERQLLSAALHAMLEPFEKRGGAMVSLPLLHLDRELSRFSALLAEEGVEKRILAVAARLKSAEQRCLAFCLSAAVAMVDDFVAGAEIEVIEDLGARLGLDPEESQNLLREVHERMGKA